LERIINIPARGLGPGAVNLAKQYALSKGAPLGVAMDDLSGLTTLPPKAMQSLTGLAQLLREFRQLPQNPVTEIVRQVIVRTGYREYLERLAQREDVDRIENVEELANAAHEYDMAHADGSLQGFLEEVALVSDVDRWDDEAKAVSLMTLHSAKGLEFPVVFIAGMEEGLLPHRQSMDTNDEIEEERRLCYVGVTRARRELTLTLTRRRARFGSFEDSEPSRFLFEMPRDVMEYRETAEGRGRGLRRPRRVEVDLHEDDFGQEYPVEEKGDYESGDRVRHPDFGIGRIVDINGTGKKRKVTVLFDKAGQKKLMLEYARLEKVG
jgi:DNA helicase-2/ATP-dependent DNA helicase PcrA